MKKGCALYEESEIHQFDVMRMNNVAKCHGCFLSIGTFGSVNIHIRK